MAYVTQLSAPVENHIREIIHDSYLAKVDAQFRPWLDIRNLQPDSVFPIVTSLSSTVAVDEESRHAYAQVQVLILHLIPELINCETEQSRELLVLQSGHAEKQSLLEISDILGNVGEQNHLYENEDYCWVGQRYYKTYQTDKLFKYMGVSKEDYEKLPFAKTIMGTGLIGTLKGRVKQFCCPVGLFQPNREAGCK